MDYKTEKIRNIALLGHQGCGKTSLIEMASKLINNGKICIYKMNIHAGIEDDDIINFMNDVKKKVKVEPEEVESFDAEVLLGNNEVSTSTVTESASSTKVSNKEAIKFYKAINDPPKDAKYVLIEQLKLWGIPENTFLYRIILSLTDIAPNGRNTYGDVNIEYKELIKNIAEILNRPTSVISSSISTFVRKRRFFTATEDFTCFKDIKDKAKINKEVFLTTIYKFILKNR